MTKYETESSLKALNIDKDDEVITVANSYLASASSIALCGAKPVFVDVMNDLNIDYRKIEDVITKKTNNAGSPRMGSALFFSALFFGVVFAQKWMKKQPKNNQNTTNLLCFQYDFVMFQFCVF